MIALLLDHLWQSSIFAFCAGLLVLALRHNSAAARFWLWFAASMKFLLPFSLLTALGSFLLAPVAPPIQAPGLLRMQPVAEPFSTVAPVLAAPHAAPALGIASSPAVALVPAPPMDLTWVLPALWLAGFLAVAFRWLMRWSKLRAVLRGAVDLGLALPVTVKASPSRLEPGLVGILRPVILLPRGIEQHLSRAQMDAILAHELCHWRRRDNLLAALHMLVEALFWFFPLVWWLGARLNAERERACDEAVLKAGNDPQTYAEGILNVCRAYLQSPLACVSGVSGAELKQRIDGIMENKLSLRLNAARKLLLGTSAAASVLLPLVLGLVVVSPITPVRALAVAALSPAPATPAANLNEPNRNNPPSQGTASTLPIATSQPESLAPPSPDLSGLLPNENLATPTVIASNDARTTNNQAATQDGSTGFSGSVAEAASGNAPHPKTEAALACLLGFAPLGCVNIFEAGQEIRYHARQGIKYCAKEFIADSCTNGPLEAVNYLGTNAAGADVYEVQFMQADSAYIIPPPGPDGKIGRFFIKWGRPNQITPSSLVDLSSSAAPKRTLYLRSADTGASSVASPPAQTLPDLPTTTGLLPYIIPSTDGGHLVAAGRNDLRTEFICSNSSVTGRVLSTRAILIGSFVCQVKRVYHGVIGEQSYSGLIMNVELGRSSDAERMARGKTVTIEGNFKVLVKNDVRYLVADDAKILSVNLSSAATPTDQAADYDKAAVAAATAAVNGAFDACKARLAANEIKTYSEMAACSLAAEHNFFTDINLKRMDTFEAYADRYQALAADRDASRVSERQARRTADKILKEFYAACKCGPAQRNFVPYYEPASNGSFLGNGFVWNSGGPPK